MSEQRHRSAHTQNPRSHKDKTIEVLELCHQIKNKPDQSDRTLTASESLQMVDMPSKTETACYYFCSNPCSEIFSSALLFASFFFSVASVSRRLGSVRERRSSWSNGSVLLFETFSSGWSMRKSIQPNVLMCLRIWLKHRPACRRSR